MKNCIQTFRREHGNLLKLLRGFLLLGGLYYLFIRITGWWIPCIFHKLTGLYCPGCGISRFFLHLLRLDYPGAMEQNLAVGILLPLWIIVGVIEFFWNPKALSPGSKWNKALILGSLILLLLFGILRNLPFFPFSSLPQ